MSNDHEDLLRDGRNMPQRAATMIGDTRVVVGIRPQGQVSVYCGQEPVYQFNQAGELRRVYHLGQRYAAHQGKLMVLKNADSTAKLSFDLEPAGDKLVSELKEMFETWWAKIIRTKTWEVAGTSSGEFSRRLLQWQEMRPQPIVIANDPNA